MNLSTRKPTTMHLQSENIAAAAPPRPSHLDAVPQRVREIAMLRGLGYSFRQIAEQFSVTPQAVSLMLSRHRHCLRSLRGAVELRNLSARAVNTLGRHGIRNREEARRRNILQSLAGARNCGRKTIEEIARWMDEGTAQS